MRSYRMPALDGSYHQECLHIRWNPDVYDTLDGAATSSAQPAVLHRSQVYPMPLRFLRILRALGYCLDIDVYSWHTHDVATSWV